MEFTDKIYQYFLDSDGVTIDSREEVKNKIFFALSGDNFNGNTFADEATKKGAKLCVIDDENFSTSNSIVVPNVLTALQKLATHHRNVTQATVIAITGTNGKTTTKELMSRVLGSNLNVIYTKGNFNNHIGVPLTLLTINAKMQIAIVEMGANHKGEISDLCRIALPNIGIITNIGVAHLEGFGSFEGIIRAKTELFTFLKENNGKVIVNGNDDILSSMSNEIPRITYGTVNTNVTGEITKYKPTLEIVWGRNNLDNICYSNLYGKYNFFNIMAAISAGVFFDVPASDINNAISSYIPNNNRSQKIKTDNNLVFLDAYNANPTSMDSALTSFKELSYNNPVYILGDMLELGDYSKVEHQEIVNLLIRIKAEKVILIGENFNETIGLDFLKFKNTDEAKAYLNNNKITNSSVFIKGSRGMKLEVLVENL